MNDAARPARGLLRGVVAGLALWSLGILIYAALS